MSRGRALGTDHMFSNDDHRYEPLSIGVAKPLMDDGGYCEILDAYLQRERSHYLHVARYEGSLAEKDNPKRYERVERIVGILPVLWEYYRCVRGEAFIAMRCGRLGSGLPISVSGCCRSPSCAGCSRSTSG